jgi:hypothetical protein
MRTAYQQFVSDFAKEHQGQKWGGGGGFLIAASDAWRESGHPSKPKGPCVSKNLSACKLLPTCTWANGQERKYCRSKPVRGVRVSKSKNKSPSPSQRGGWELTDQELKELKDEKLSVLQAEAKAEANKALGVVIALQDKDPALIEAKEAKEARSTSDNPAKYIKAEEKYNAAMKALEVRDDYKAADKAYLKASKYEALINREIIRRKSMKAVPSQQQSRSAQKKMAGDAVAKSQVKE